MLRVLPVQEKIDRYAISMEDLVSMRYSLLSAVKYVLAGFLFFSWIFSLLLRRFVSYCFFSSALFLGYECKSLFFPFRFL